MTTAQESDQMTPEDLSLYDIQKKMAVAKLIVTECMKNTIKEDVQNNEFYKCAMSYMSTSEIMKKKIFDSINSKQRPKRFSEWFQEQSWEKEESLKIVTTPVDSLLWATIVDHYVHRESIPTVSSIREEVNSKGFNLTILEVKKLLRMNGYMTQRLPNTSATIIVENPKQRLMKMKYLYEIIQYNNINKHVVYIEDKIIMIQNNNVHVVSKEMIRVIIAVSSVMGLIVKDVQVMPVTSDKMINIEDWVIKNLLPYLSLPSLIVLEKKINSTNLNNIPTIDSKKSDMIDWLTSNEIPHRSEMHSAELYELIKRSKRTCSMDKQKFDEILKGHGHKVLHRPHPTNNFNIFSSIWDQIAAHKDHTVEKELSDTINNTLSYVKIIQWKDIINAFFSVEKKLYEDTNALDEVIDKIMTYAKYERIPDEAVQQCDEGIDEIKMSEIVRF